MDAAQKVSKTSIQLLLSDPFYGNFLIGIPKTFDHNMQSIGLGLGPSSKIMLLINPRFWSEAGEETKKGLIKHEILHLILGHFTTYDYYENRLLFHIAADLECNQFIPSNQLPSTALRAENFGFSETDQDAAFFYKKLKSLYAKKSTASLAPHYSEIKKHRHWIIKEKFPSGRKKIIAYQIQKMLTQTIQSIEKATMASSGLPEGLVEKISVDFIEQPALPKWYAQLHNFLASGTKTWLKNTLHRPSKRYGTVPGIKIRRKQKLLIALDTSGSIDQQALNEIFTVIELVRKQVGAVIIAECDFEIRKIYLFNGIIPEGIKGRGDTAYEPVINFANEQYQPDALIYFTDGFGTAPEITTRYPLLWIITSEGIEKNTAAWSQFPGSIIKLT